MINIDELPTQEKLILAKTSNDINILTILSKDKDEYIRAYVASNKNTPVEILSLLAKEQDRYTREFVAYNKNTSIEILKELINDEDEHVKQIAIKRLAYLKGLNSFI